MILERPPPSPRADVPPNRGWPSPPFESKLRKQNFLRQLRRFIVIHWKIKLAGMLVVVAALAAVGGGFSWDMSAFLGL